MGAEGEWGMRVFYFEHLVPQSLLDDGIDPYEYLRSGFEGRAYSYETPDDAAAEAYPSEIYRCVHIIGPMNEGKITPNIPPGFKVYGGYVRRERD